MTRPLRFLSPHQKALRMLKLRRYGEASNRRLRARRAEEPRVVDAPEVRREVVEPDRVPAEAVGELPGVNDLDGITQGGFAMRCF